MNDAPPSFFALSLTHKASSLGVRERMAIDAHNIKFLYNLIKETSGIQECLILNTCNRVEFYCVANLDHFPKVLFNILGEFYNLDLGILLEHFLFFSNQQALEHLFKVASGVDSQIVGEVEIFGQIKKAYQQGVACQAVGPVLHKIFQKAFQVTKFIRTHSTINKGHLSMGNIVLHITKRVFESLADVPTLILGAGEVGQQVLKALCKAGSKDITILNRSLANAQKIAHIYHARSDILGNISDYIGKSGLIIGSASISSFLMDKNLINTVIKKRRQPLLLIDLALPRNFCPSCAQIPNVYLYNLDDLCNVAQGTLAKRREAADNCLAIIAEKGRHIWPKIHAFIAEKALL